MHRVEPIAISMRNGFIAFSALLVCAVQATAAPKPPGPSLGPKATVIRNTNLYVCARHHFCSDG